MRTLHHPRGRLGLVLHLDFPILIVSLLRDDPRRIDIRIIKRWGAGVEAGIINCGLGAASYTFAVGDCEKLALRAIHTAISGGVGFFWRAELDSLLWVLLLLGHIEVHKLGWIG